MMALNVARIAGLVLLAAPATTWGQTPAEDFKFSTRSELVALDVGVKDAAGGFIKGLTKDNFKVYENGKLQTISQFGVDDIPVTVGLVIDDSGSMRPKRAEVITAGMGFVSGSNPNDEIFVTHFNDHVRLGLPKGVLFSDNMQVLRPALMSGTAEGRTSLYDALVASIEHLELGKEDRKAILLVSDGGDNASVHTLNDVIAAVRDSAVTIYTIGIFDEDDPDRDPALLRRLASASGGEAFFPKELPEVLDICRQIAKDIRNRYTLGYVPVRTDEKVALRTVKVVVTGTSHKAMVHSRTSYLLPASR